MNGSEAQPDAGTALAEPHGGSGMGAVPMEEGIHFRVWAPHADQVWVTGSFNGWSKKAHPLVREEEGEWSGLVPEAGVGDAYRFVIKNGRRTFDRIDPYARVIDRSEKNGIVYDGGAFDWEGVHFEMPPWNELVLYEMHVGTFFTDDDEPGNFQRAMERLDHVSGLGANAIAMMPVAEFPGKRSWGYDLSYPFAVERSYGGPDGLKRFIKEAHRRGIALVMDVVYNHFGPMGLDLWRFDGWGEGETGGIWFYNDPRLAKTPWGHTRPNFGIPQVKRLVRDNLAMWAEEFQVDGFRWDGTVFIRKLGFFPEDPELPEGWALMQEMNQFVHERYPGKIIIAEDLQAERGLTIPVEEGGGGFDSQWDAGFDHRVRDALVPERDEDRNVEAVWEAVADCYNGIATHRVIYTESHDAVSGQQERFRVPYEINRADPESWASKKRSTLGAALVLTSPGIPMLFQGQSFMEHEWFDKDHALNWEKQERLKGITQMYRDLIELRCNRQGTTRGLLGDHTNVFHRNVAGKVFAFHRWDRGGPGDDTVVVANFSGQALSGYRIGLSRGGRWRVRLNTDWRGYDAGFSDHPAWDLEAEPGSCDGMPASGEVSVGAYTVVVLSQDVG